MQGEMQPQRGSGFSWSPSPSTVVSPHLLSESAAAAVPNPHTQRGSEQHTLAVPEFRSLRRVSGHEALGVSRAVFLSEGTRGECFLVLFCFVFFRFLEAAHIPWLVAPSSIFKVHHGLACLSHIRSP